MKIPSAIQGMLRFKRETGALTFVPLSIAVVVAIAALFVRPDETDAKLAEVTVPPSIESTSPFLVRHVSQATALSINAAIPFAKGANPPAEPFPVIRNDEARENALNCLTAAVYYEAAGEGSEGEQAVAQVVLNRVRHPLYPATICGVVFEGSTRATGCQFSFTCDGSLERSPDGRSWAEARKVADAALSGAVYAPIGLSTHYHANYVVPYWASQLAKSAQVGLHIFYRFQGSWGSRIAFHQASSSAEGSFATLRAAALMSRGAWADLAYADSSPGILPAADPNAELVRVVDLLGRPAAADSTPYEAEIRSHFANAIEHPAVKLLQSAEQKGVSFTAITLQLASARRSAKGVDAVPVAIEAANDAATSPDLPTALADFSRVTDFNGFFRAHRHAYRAAALRTEQLTRNAAEDWTAYTGMGVPGSAAVGAAGDPCINRADLTPASNAGATPGAGFRTTAPDVVLTMASMQAPWASQALKKSKAANAPDRVDLCARYEVMRAVFARIAQLSRPGSSSRSPERVAASRGADVELLKQLRFYEGHREQYPTLTEFLPKLFSAVRAPLPAKTIMANAALVSNTCGEAASRDRLAFIGTRNCVTAP